MHIYILHRLDIHHGFVHVTCSVCFKLRSSVFSCSCLNPELGKLIRFGVGSPQKTAEGSSFLRVWFEDDTLEVFFDFSPPFCGVSLVPSQPQKLWQDKSLGQFLLINLRWSHMKRPWFPNSPNKMGPLLVPNGLYRFRTPLNGRK